MVMFVKKEWNSSGLMEQSMKSIIRLRIYGEQKWSLCSCSRDTKERIPGTNVRTDREILGADKGFWITLTKDESFGEI